MSNFLAKATEWLEDHALLREAVTRTARDTGFASPLVEKDFFCSVALAVLGLRLPEHVVLRGGTCLSKVYTDFYRLSEDLDFAIPIQIDSKRSQRRALIEPVNDIVDTIPSRCPHLAVRQALRGANVSTHYTAVLEYESRIDGRPAEVKVEFALREPSLCAATTQDAATLLLNPITGRPALPAVSVHVMAPLEVWAEKTRAALTRREVAIRDFFDLDYALQEAKLDPQDQEFFSLVRHKISVPGTEPLQLTVERRAALEAQLSTKLRPALRMADSDRFDLNRIWQVLLDLENLLK